MHKVFVVLIDFLGVLICLVVCVGRFVCLSLLCGWRIRCGVNFQVDINDKHGNTPCNMYVQINDMPLH